MGSETEDVVQVVSTVLHEDAVKPVGTAEQLKVLVACQPLVQQWFLGAVAKRTVSGEHAGIALERPDQDLHERRFSRTVLASEANYFAGP